ncbi:amidohydrolase [Nafulsella turpanensis]|uniref:amidohydrolase n=1 Tax=Nafulsella turpanensis TaxID=1265690 RepID=UPI00037C6C8B|nr:amidohydrolase [Nafulsella turpanensis]
MKRNVLSGLLAGTLLGSSILSGCGSDKETVDYIITNAKIYTVDSLFSRAEALAVKDGRFVEVGQANTLLELYETDSLVDLEGAAVYPGLIDAHAHFYRYGLGLTEADLTGTTSFAEVLERLKAHREEYPESPWIIGRGWDQNDWDNKAFPTRKELDELYPETPVLLTRVDGHAALVNQRALELAGIDAGTSILGGKVIVEAGKPTGVLVDNAIDLVSHHIPEPNRKQQIQTLLQAQENTFAVGLTTVDDAGLEKATVDLIDSLQKAGALKMRVYAMLNPSETNKAYYFENGPYVTDHLSVTSFKVYGDGALGSRGANLLEPYHDDPKNYGFLLRTPEAYAALAEEIHANDFQMNTHAIGDSANRTLLNIYSKVLEKDNDRRWRIEHAQVVAPVDLDIFGEYNIIPSVQPTHATSDMYWAADRLGDERVKTAYTYQDLLEATGMLALGSDFPVEHINPLYGFHSAVARKDAEGFPEGGFQPENKISREDALRGMTIWAAYSNFEEDIKGSIEAGKLADFVVLEKDIMEAPEEELRDIKVRFTVIGGEKVFAAPDPGNTNN